MTHIQKCPKTHNSDASEDTMKGIRTSGLKVYFKISLFLKTVVGFIANIWSSFVLSIFLWPLWSTRHFYPQNRCSPFVFWHHSVQHCSTDCCVWKSQRISSFWNIQTRNELQLLDLATHTHVLVEPPIPDLVHPFTVLVTPTLLGRLTTLPVSMCPFSHKTIS